MDENLQKEEFSRAFVHAVATVAGFSAQRVDPDDDSIDVRISGRGSEGTSCSPRFEIQLKCTSRDEVVHEEEVRYPLSIKNYNDLRKDALVPRGLVVVLVPEAIVDWITESEQELAMRHCGYWTSIRGHGPTDNVSSVTVKIPRSKRLTAETLQEIMKRIGANEKL